MERNEVLDSYLSDLRRSAKLSVEQVCLRTKIQQRFVVALEAGRWSEVPSNTHLRAFSLALAKACGGDEAHAAALVRRLLAATAPVPDLETGARGFDTPSPSPAVAREPLSMVAFPAPRAALAPAGASPALDGPMKASPLLAASARLRSLPLSMLLSLLALAGTLSYSAAWSVEHWRQREVSAILGAAGPLGVSIPAAEAAAPSTAAGGAAPASALPGAETAALAAGEASAPLAGLTLRARRACWLVLEIDGKRLPTVTMLDGDKLNWGVSQRAVLLAGNVGALRVWWQGDNDGYLGELDQRANALVFERGKQPRLDPSAAMALPVGIPQ